LELFSSFKDTTWQNDNRRIISSGENILAKLL
jgi:hypothetical protein